MAWRGLHLSEPAHLKHKDNSLVCVREQGEIRVPIEDIAFVIIDGNEITLTSPLLSALGQSGVTVVFCDNKHLPCSTLLSYGQHHRHPEISSLQKAMSPSLSGAVWKAVVRQKILNQAEILRRQAGHDQAQALVSMAKRVKPGDPDNIEARAARDYWSSLFADFRRRDDTDARNMALNYGYAIVRSIVARSCVGHGLVTAFGIKHASVSNGFNLADDLMEPFRPVVDLAVCSMTLEEANSRLSKSTRQELASIPMKEVRLGDTIIGIMPAAD